MAKAKKAPRVVAFTTRLPAPMAARMDAIIARDFANGENTLTRSDFVRIAVAEKCAREEERKGESSD